MECDLKNELCLIDLQVHVQNYRIGYLDVYNHLSYEHGHITEIKHEICKINY